MSNWHKRAVIWSLLILLIGVAGTGCGDGGEASGDSPSPLARAEFVKRANQICEKRIEEKEQLVGRAFERSAKAPPDSPPAGAFKELVEGITVPYEALTKELSELPVTGKNKVAVEDLVGGFQAGFKTVESNPRAIMQGQPFAPASAAAKAHGIKGCTF